MPNARNGAALQSGQLSHSLVTHTATTTVTEEASESDIGTLLARIGGFTQVQPKQTPDRAASKHHQ